MPIIVEMPSLSPSMAKGNLVSWCKKEGDEILVGDVIAEIDTDKATMEVESIHKGTLEKILVPAGTHDVIIKAPIAILRQKNDTDAQIQEVIDTLKKQQAIGLQMVVDEINDIEIIATEKAVEKLDSKIKASPLAKRIANEYGIDITKINGTGPGNRVVKIDVLNSKPDNIQTQQYAFNDCEYIDEDITTMRRVIAERLTKSKQETPHAYMEASANVSELIDVRNQINSAIDTKILIDAFVAKATSIAMKNFPEINSSWIDGKIRRYKNIDISIAVAIEGGVITPIVRNCDQKSLKEISIEIRELANKAKSGSLKPHEFSGGGITISNLGMFNIDSFLSIINPPQGSILSIGPSKKTPIFNENDDLIQAFIMKVGYALDHRITDGALAAKFLCNVVRYLENPIALLAY